MTGEFRELGMDQLEIVAGSSSVYAYTMLQLPQPPETAQEAALAAIMKRMNDTADSIINNMKN